MELDKKVTIITGAASGIGAACARAFAAKGARVVASDINGAGVAAVAEEIGGLGIACDVADEADVRRLVSETEAALGPVDIFFSNAGIISNCGPLDATDAVWDQQWGVNVMSHIYALRAVLPGMLERGDGYLIHTASTAGILSSHGDLPYAMAKHAVVGLAEWMSFTYHDRGIRTSMLAPLGVQTPLLDNMALDSSAIGEVKTPEAVAAMVIDAVEEERFMILTDDLAQKWMEGKTRDIDRWLRGMRKLQSQSELP